MAATSARSFVMQKIRNFAIYNLGFPVVRTVERLLDRFSQVGDAAIFDHSHFSWCQELETNWKSIRHELDEIVKHRERLPNLQSIAVDQASLTTDDGWKTYFLYAFGYKSEANCQRCPETTRMLERIPGLKTAMFSILSPKKHIPRHRGAYKGLIRCHLGLLVPGPRGACRMELADETIHWGEGELFIFDNTRHHEVWNDSDSIRVVLLFDIVRPFPFPISTINATIIRLMSWSSYIRDARKNQARWEREFEASVGAGGAS